MEGLLMAPDSSHDQVTLIHLTEGIGHLKGSVGALSLQVAAIQTEQMNIRREIGQGLTDVRREMKADIQAIANGAKSSSGDNEDEIRKVREKIVFASGWVAAAGVIVGFLVPWALKKWGG
jgi:ElaB/YqjD/DUF883 family membrane-anchored ribosome-binding protein